MIFVFFCLTSLTVIISRSVHDAANGILSFFFNGWIIFHCIYVPCLLYPFLFWCTFKCRFHVLGTVNTGVLVSFQICKLRFSPNICPGVGLLDPLVALFLAFWGTSILFSILLVSLYIPTNSVGQFPFLQTLSSVYCF